MADGVAAAHGDGTEDTNGKDSLTGRFEEELRKLAQKQEEMSGKLQKTMANTNNFCQAIEAIVLLEERCKSLDERLTATASAAAASPASPASPATPQQEKVARNDVTPEQLNAALRSVKEAVGTAHHASNTVLGQLDKVQQKVDEESQLRCSLEDRLAQDLQVLASQTLASAADSEKRFLEAADQMQDVRDRLDAVADTSSHNEVAMQLQDFKCKLEEHSAKWASQEDRQSTFPQVAARLQDFKCKLDEHSAQWASLEGRLSSEFQGMDEPNVKEAFRDTNSRLSELASRCELTLKDSDCRIADLEARWGTLDARLAEMVARSSDEGEQAEDKAALYEDTSARLVVLEAHWESLDARLASTARGLGEVSAAQEASVENVDLTIKAAQEATESRYESLSSRLACTSRGLQEVSEAQGIWSETVNLSLKAAQDAMDAGMDSLKTQRSELGNKLLEVEEHLTGQAELAQSTKIDIIQQLEEFRAQLGSDISTKPASKTGQSQDDSGSAVASNSEESAKARLRMSVVDSRLAALEDSLNKQSAQPDIVPEQLKAVMSSMHAEMESFEDQLMERFEANKTGLLETILDSLGGEVGSSPVLQAGSEGLHFTGGSESLLTAARARATSIERECSPNSALALIARRHRSPQAVTNPLLQGSTPTSSSSHGPAPAVQRVGYFATHKTIRPGDTASADAGTQKAMSAEQARVYPTRVGQRPSDLAKKGKGTGRSPEEAAKHGSAAGGMVEAATVATLNTGESSQPALVLTSGTPAHASPRSSLREVSTGTPKPQVRRPSPGSRNSFGQRILRVSPRTDEFRR